MVRACVPEYTVKIVHKFGFITASNLLLLLQLMDLLGCNILLTVAPYALGIFPMEDVNLYTLNQVQGKKVHPHTVESNVLIHQR